MSDDVEQLSKDFEKFRKMATREIEAQAKAIRELQKEVEDLKKEDSKLIKYVNNLMAKADKLIKSNYASLRRTQVIDRQKMNDLDNEVSQISQKVRKK